MYNFTLLAGTSTTIELPSGATTFYVTSTNGISIFRGRTTTGPYFQMVTGNKMPITIENFKGGLYTFKETTGAAPSTVLIWSQGLEDFF
tara:strand:+ start:586 stop:852 length:267 start_codon:yes stop_codon:yes gene_type:complete